MNLEEKATDNNIELPPFFKSWKQMYIFVLVLHIILISILYSLTQYYS